MVQKKTEIYEITYIDLEKIGIKTRKIISVAKGESSYPTGEDIALEIEIVPKEDQKCKND